MRLAVLAIAALTLAACSRSDSGDVSQANNQINAAGSESAAAANHLAAAASRDLKADTAKAADATGAALEKAGKDIRGDVHHDDSQNP